MPLDNRKDPFDLIARSKRTIPTGGFSWAAWNKKVTEPKPTLIPDSWPAPKERTDKVFAKSCNPGKWSCTDAGTASEPASNFGNVMLAGAMLMPSASTAVAAAISADLALGRMAGGGIMQQGFMWALRAAGGPASIFVLGMLPAKMGDGTLYTDEQLRKMARAPTRVRFQFRRDAEGELHVYGIHTSASGDDTISIVEAMWNSDKTAVEAKLNGITLLWTPRRGYLGEMLPQDYPDKPQMGTILVHPIPEGTDSEIEGLPGEDITADDCIVVFPAGTGLNSLYVVFARPVGGDLKYHKPPLVLPAFPDTFPVKSKSSVQGGGGKRTRWKDRKGRIYEWDSQHGAVEMYDQQGKHLGEFNPETGEQTKPAKPGRTTPK